MTLWILYGLLNQYTKERHITFNPMTAVILQNVCKWNLSFFFYLQEMEWKMSKLLFDLSTYWKYIFYYAIPALLYACYDILSYYNLQVFDPSTYFLLLQFRLVLTAFLHQICFTQYLTKTQWIALFITTCGCGFKTAGDQLSQSETTQHILPTLGHYGLLMIQLGCSTIAGVYNELLLKKKSEISLHLQNVFLYSNAIAMISFSRMVSSSTSTGWQDYLIVLTTPSVLILVLLMSSVGIVTSLFLKHLDSVRKAMASALELVFLPLLSWFFFQTPLTFHLLLAVMCVSLGVYLYSHPKGDISFFTQKKKKIINPSRMHDVV